MRNLIFLFLFLLVPCIAFAGFSVDGVTDPASVDGVTNPASVDGVTSDYDPCDIYSADEPYEFIADTQHASGYTYACINSGTTVNTTDASAGVAVDGWFLLDADGEHVRWDAPSGTAHVDGFVEFDLVAPSSFSHDQILVEIYGDGNNQGSVYYNHTQGRYYAKFYTTDGAVTAYIGDADTAVNADEEIHILWTWQRTGTDKHQFYIDAVKKDDDTEDIGVLNTAPTSISVGEDQIAFTGGTDGWKVLNVKYGEGYQGD